MRNGVLGVFFGVVLVVWGVVQPANATPLVGGDFHAFAADTPWFCGGWCGDHGPGSEPWNSAFTLLNDAHIFQVNLCVGCATAIQTNIANITQINSIMGGLVQLAEPIGSDSGLEGYVTSLQTNLARVVQFNLCLDCPNADQLNLATIEQGNVLDVASFGDVYRSTSPGDPIGSHVPEPGTLLLLGSGFLVLGLRRRLAGRRFAADGSSLNQSRITVHVGGLDKPVRSELGGWSSPPVTTIELAAHNPCESNSIGRSLP